LCVSFSFVFFLISCFEAAIYAYINFYSPMNSSSKKHGNTRINICKAKAAKEKIDIKQK